LKRIATGRALDQLRSRHRRTTRFSPMPDQPLADASALDPAALACGGELAEALRVALSAIDPQQAAAFCLVALEEFTNGDAAGQLGITPNHLGVLLHRARTALRERLYAFAPHRLLSPGGRP
jgi:RNA polymerase sigma-70 factor (ECF subfamily)